MYLDTSFVIVTEPTGRVLYLLEPQYIESPEEVTRSGRVHAREIDGVWHDHRGRPIDDPKLIAIIERQQEIR